MTFRPAIIAVIIVTVGAWTLSLPPTAPTGSMGDHATGVQAVPHVHMAQPIPAAAAQHAPDMESMEAAKIKAFPAKTAGVGNQLLAYTRLPDGTKVFELTAKVVQWEVEPGVRREAWTYNGMVPGPVIRVTEGDRVRVVLHNQLPESTAVHFHGMRLPNDQDGVPFLTQPPVRPGQTYTYGFVAAPAGTQMYHSHFDTLKQVTMGLLGAFIVDPKDLSGQPKVAQDIVMVLGDGPLGYILNGKSFPATAPIVARLGQTVRIRYMNEGQMIHPMHLHGLPQRVIAKDGYTLEHPYLADTLLVAPGERYDVLVKADAVGAWAYHCHILSHAEGDEGMFGTVTAFIVQK